MPYNRDAKFTYGGLNFYYRKIMKELDIKPEEGDW